MTSERKFGRHNTYEFRGKRQPGSGMAGLVRWFYDHAARRWGDYPDRAGRRSAGPARPAGQDARARPEAGPRRKLS
jgi:hypothetical protein